MRRRHELVRVVWQPPGNQSQLLAESGIAHGFVGKGGTPPDAQSAKQVHGTTVVRVPAEGLAATPEADGLITTAPGRRVAVRTADCLPILAVDARGKAAFAVHAGWRGLTSGILRSAVAEAAGLGVAASSLTVAIGPAISRERYEVGEEVVQALESPNLGLDAADAALCTAKGRGDRWHADLLLAAVLALLDLGVPAARINAMQACTFGDERWHSYRREGKGAGSNWSWISL